MFSHGQFRERVKVGAVGTFAAGWLLPRLAGFYDSHPHIDLHISTHNNHVGRRRKGMIIRSVSVTARGMSQMRN